MDLSQPQSVLLSPEEENRDLNLKVVRLEAKLEDTVDLLHIWKNHAFSYQKILEMHKIDTSSIDQKVMADYLAELRGG